MSPNSLKSASRLKAGPLGILFSALVLVAMLLVACGGPSSQPGTTQTPSGKKSVLKIAAQSYEFAEAGFNVYGGGGHPNIGVDLVYETLEFVNVSDNSYTPVLATSHQFNTENTQVTFNLREGVKWNDGQPFTADDVVFTFNLMKQYPAADAQALWPSYLKDVVASDPKTVVVTFQQSFPPALPLIVHTRIVAKHIFEKVGDPTKYISSKLVGTGPFVLDNFKPDLAVFKKNPSYWAADQLKIDEVRFPLYASNDTAILALASDQVDWGGYFAQNLKEAFVNKDPQHHKMFMPPVNTYSICPNLKNEMLADKNVRLAISAALDRTAIAKQATGDLFPPGHPTGLILPTAQKWLSPEYGGLVTTPEAAKAEKYLTDAGYTKGSDGIYQKGGNRLSFELRSVDSYSDWNSAGKLVADQLKAVGIEIKNVTIGESAYYDSRANGKFDYQMMFCGMVGGSSPFYLYNSYLNSANVGQGKTNFSGWSDPNTDKFLSSYVSTTDEAKQKEAIIGIEKIFVENAPFFPLWVAGEYSQYSTKNFTGWPDESNPYALASPNRAPDYKMIIMKLQPAS